MASQACSVCSNPAAEAIDSLLVAGVPYRRIQNLHRVTPSALSRHRTKHLSPSLAVVTGATVGGTSTATDSETMPSTETVLRQLAGLLERTRRILDKAEADGRPQVALQAVREARQVLETSARVSGVLDERPVTVVNLAASPEWLHVRAVILRALGPHPQAQLDVAQALAAMDGDVVDAEIVPELAP